MNALRPHRPFGTAPDLTAVYRACNPSQTLNINHPDERPYYIDLTDARGGDIVRDLEASIALFSPDAPTCQLFAGHIGCGKSTELRRLQALLQSQGFAVLYFESSRDLDMADLDVGDVLLAIARQVSDAFGALAAVPPHGTLCSLVQTANQLVATDIPTLDPDGQRGTFAFQLRKLSANTHGRPDLRSQLRQYLEPRIQTFLDALNRELIDPVVERLRADGKQGLVILVDNLDRIEMTQKPWGRPQPEYLFVDRGDRLCKLHCHVVYTIPSSLLFSRDISRLTLCFGVDPKVLPMVAVKQRDGKPFQAGLERLRQMVLARAFPERSLGDRAASEHLLFDRPDTLDRLCYASGGHARNLLRLLHRQIEKERRFPLSRAGLDAIVRERREQLLRAITSEERQLLQSVLRHKQVSGNADYQVLIRSMLVFEYRDDRGAWFDVNPILGA